MIGAAAGHLDQVVALVENIDAVAAALPLIIERARQRRAV
jgi:hypothetical protein